MLSFKIKEVDKIKLQEVNYFLIISVGAKGKIEMSNGWYRKPQPGQLNGRSYHEQSDPKNVHKEPRNENYFENDHIFFEIDQLQGNL